MRQLNPMVNFFHPYEWCIQESYLTLGKPDRKFCIQLSGRPVVKYNHTYAPVYQLSIDITEPDQWIAEIGTFTVYRDNQLPIIKIVEEKHTVYLRDCKPLDTEYPHVEIELT